MTVSRRGFLRSGSMIALATALPLSLATVAAGQQRRGAAPRIPGPLTAGSGASRSNSLDFFNHQTFAAHVNTTFRVNSERPAEIVLLEVGETPLIINKRTTRVPSGENFTLTFQGPSKTRFTQETYTLDHDSLGRFELFLVPTGLRAEQQTYIAVINRRH